MCIILISLNANSGYFENTYALINKAICVGFLISIGQFKKVIKQTKSSHCSSSLLILYATLCSIVVVGTFIETYVRIIL